MRYSPIMPSIMIISMSGNMQFYPVYADKIKTGIKIQSITKIFFINNLPYNNGVKVIISRERTITIVKKWSLTPISDSG